MTLNGKTIHDHQSFVNIYSNFKMLSSMSPSDLKSNNTNFGMASELDNHRSMEFLTAAIIAATNGVSGFGITNNNPYDTAASRLQTIKQNDGKGNPALYQRINRTVDTTRHELHVLRHALQLHGRLRCLEPRRCCRRRRVITVITIITTTTAADDCGPGRSLPHCKPKHLPLHASLAATLPAPADIPWD